MKLILVQGDLQDGLTGFKDEMRSIWNRMNRDGNRFKCRPF